MMKRDDDENDSGFAKRGNAGAKNDPKGAENANAYSVGYGKPPTETRWKKGQSGNPRGRPLQTASLPEVLYKAVMKTVTATERGVTRKITKLDAMATHLANRAARGDPRATRDTVAILSKIPLPPGMAEPMHIIVTGGLPEADDD